MNAAENPYQKLYLQLKNQFTVSENGKDYTLGEYMQNRAVVSRESAPLPVRASAAPLPVALNRFMHYIQDKLTVKVPPVKDKTMRRFPLRTSLSSALSAVTACSLLFSFALFGARAVLLPNTEETVYLEETEEDADPQTEELPGTSV